MDPVACLSALSKDPEFKSDKRNTTEANPHGEGILEASWQLLGPVILPLQAPQGNL